MIKVSYDPRADALYLQLREAKIEESDEVSSGVIADYDRRSRPIGIEVLDASQLVGNRSHLQLDVALADLGKR